MTSTIWRHLSGFLQWPRLCGDILLDFYNNLVFMEASFWIPTMTSALWRHPSGFLQWPRLYGDILLDSSNDLKSVETSFWIATITSTLWRRAFSLEFLPYSLTSAIWRYNSSPLFILAQVSAWWRCHFISLFIVDHHPIIDNILTHYFWTGTISMESNFNFDTIWNEKWSGL